MFNYKHLELYHIAPRKLNLTNSKPTTSQGLILWNGVAILIFKHGSSDIVVTRMLIFEGIYIPGKQILEFGLLRCKPTWCGSQDS